MDSSNNPISRISMTYLNPIKKKLAKENRKVSVQDPSKLLAEFFSGVVIKLDEEYIYD
jgi:hypothetical protein